MAKLFDKTKIKGLELKNRFVRSATNEEMADRDGFPTENLFKLYGRLAKGGVGLIITGLSAVSADGRTTPRMNCIYSDDHIEKFRELADHVHENGSKIAMQIAHAGRQTTKKLIGTQPIAPSPVRDMTSFTTPREMTEEDIERVIEDFAKAARRAKEGGFDAVQLHCAHGYLISQFLCPYTNRRRDRWGGSVENRMRFLTKIYGRVRELVGDGYPILVKMNGYDMMKGGLDIDEAAVQARMMKDMGIDGIEVSCGIGEDGLSSLRGDIPIEAIIDDLGSFKKQPVMRFIMRHFGKKIIKTHPFSEEYNLDAARAIKSSVKIPVFAVGGNVDPAKIRGIVERGDSDYVSLCRSLIIEPGFPKQIEEGRTEPSRCIHCNLCLFYLELGPLRCYRGKRVKKG
ncbi:MAG: NADH:flavin oxidoreductase [Deltaproteobacteria bacterium]|uniref:NADH:flavin oxidoreductase n=1 Tax=Candidatus Zymogenus saltonus TaxID=2844893 RepID=A0A9D8PMR1_9DELT|nr:NADH:flavin oxidoreductase [Candidatus Zymogenus saltonus]